MVPVIEVLDDVNELGTAVLAQAFAGRRVQTSAKLITRLTKVNVERNLFIVSSPKTL